MRKITTLALLLALAAPFEAHAAVRTIAPPGNSEADQYYETLPGSAGPRAPVPKKKPEDAVREGQLSPATAEALQRRGAEGVALATAVAKTAPVRRSGGGSPVATFPGGARAPDEQGLGDLFVPLLALTAVVSAAFLIARRRPARR